MSNFDALIQDLVIANLPDGRVIAMSRNTGEIVWDKMMATTNEFGNKEKFVTAPITAEDKVLIANGAGDAGTRGWVAALEARTGKELWRWYVVPKPGDAGSETWKDKNNAWKTGGGGIWQTGSYDPATKLSIWGTGNPVPQYDPQSRPGDNLYTDAQGWRLQGSHSRASAPRQQGKSSVPAPLGPRAGTIWPTTLNEGRCISRRVTCANR